MKEKLNYHTGILLFTLTISTVVFTALAMAFYFLFMGYLADSGSIFFAGEYREFGLRGLFVSSYAVILVCGLLLSYAFLKIPDGERDSAGEVFNYAMKSFLTFDGKHQSVKGERLPWNYHLLDKALLGLLIGLVIDLFHWSFAVIMITVPFAVLYQLALNFYGIEEVPVAVSQN